MVRSSPSDRRRGASVGFILAFYGIAAALTLIAAAITFAALSAREVGAVETTGTITASEERREHDSVGPPRTVHRPTIEFTDESGTRRTIRGDDQGQPAAVGDPAIVHYHPDDPADAWHADKRNEIVIPFIILLFTAGFVVAGLVHLIKVLLRRSR